MVTTVYRLVTFACDDILFTFSYRFVDRWFEPIELWLFLVSECSVEVARDWQPSSARPADRSRF